MSLIQRENRLGLKKATTWGEAVEPSTNDGFFVKSHTPPKGGRKIVTNDDEFGRGMATSGEVLEYEEQSGSMSMRCYWEGIEPIVASLMGNYASQEVEAGVVIKHEFILDPVIDSIFHTIAWDEGDEVKAVRTAKITGGTFNYADGLNLDLNYLGDKVTVPGGWASSLNVTYPSEGKGIFKLTNATVQINNEGDADFTTGDTLNPSGIQIVITRGYEGLPITAGHDYAEEPLEKNAPVFEITLNFPKKETATKAYLDAFYNRSYKKMRIKFEGDDISGSTATPKEKYFLELNFPKLMLTEAPEYTQETPIPTTVKLKALKASANPTGMTRMVPYIFIQNGIAALTGYPAP